MSPLADAAGRDNGPLAANESSGMRELSLTASVPQTQQPADFGGGNFVVYDLQGLRGVLAAPQTDLSLILIGVPADATPASLEAVLGKTLTAAGQPDIGIDTGIKAASALVGDARWPNAGYMNLFQEASAMQAGAVGHEVLVVPVDCVDALARRVSKQTGTEGLLCRLEVSRSRLCVRWLAGADGPRSQQDPSGVLLAMVRILQGLGQTRAAQRLQDAWLVTLEEGYHTPALKHIAPYTQSVSSAAFLDQVSAGLGRSPSRLSWRKLTSPAPVRARLQVVG
ncbi:MAG: hypothetical protein AB8B93_16785 [Pseudomonadales bacterium]